ncbi:DMT family transporter [Bradyrhizobium sp. USDA 336]|uniref:DMT family transporter n=1 Tax=Bradyrhizobium sp. USDA 336 TaxID=3156311 RepID=UPI0038358DE0
MIRDSELSGIANVIFAGLMLVAMAAIIKIVTKTLSPFEVVVLRSLISAPLLFFIVPRHSRLDFRAYVSKEHFLRSALGYGGFAAFATCSSKLPLTLVSSISYTSPIYCMLFSTLLLKESRGFATGSAATIGFLGALVITRPGLDDFDIWVVVGLIGAILDSIAIVMVRRLANTAGPGQMSLSFMLWSSVIGLPIAIPVWVWPSPADWALLLLLAVFAVLAQVALVSGYARVRLSRAAPFDFVRLPASLAIDVLCFDTTPTLAMWLGSGLIFFGASVALVGVNIHK